MKAVRVCCVPDQGEQCLAKSWLLYHRIDTMRDAGKYLTVQNEEHNVASGCCKLQNQSEEYSNLNLQMTSHEEITEAHG